MDGRTFRAALISTDPEFRAQVHSAFDRQRDLDVSVALEIPARFSAFDEELVSRLRESAPNLVVVDLQDDPELGVKFIQFLADTAPGVRVIAAGPALSSDQLLAAMRAGVSDFLAKPVETGQFLAAVERVTGQLGRAAGGDTARKPGQIIAVFGAKGGAGATTFASNLAIIVHRLTGKKTLLVDLDLELGEVALLLGVQPRFNFVDMVQNFHRMDAGLLASYIDQHSSGVHLLSAPYHPERAEQVSGDEIRRILHFLRQHYDYIVVDTSKSFSPATMAAFDQSDQVFLVTTVDLPSLRNIQRGLPMLKRVLRRGEEQVRLVVNRYHDDNPISLDDVRKAVGLKVYWTISNDYEAVMDSINSGKPIVLNGKSAYAQDLRALGSDLAGLGPVADRGRGGFTLVRKLLGRRTEDTK
jgi:pilus assembly protein CpaE